MKKRFICRRLRSARRAAELRSQKGQALVETVMAIGFLVAIAVAINKLLRPVVLEAFEKIATALSSVGP